MSDIPAFPTTPGPYLISDGMSLRDYFAAKAMQAWLPIWVKTLDFDLCQRAYSTADNMIKARNK